MKINKIKRLYEDDMMQMQAPVQAMPQMPQMMAPQMAQTQMPMDVETALTAPETEMQMEFPIDNQPQVGAMQMTVADFLQKCKEVDPLVCMGIESFIEKNKMVFGGDMMPAQGEDEFKELEFEAPKEDDMAQLEFPVEENPA